MGHGIESYQSWGDVVVVYISEIEGDIGLRGDVGFVCISEIEGDIGLRGDVGCVCISEIEGDIELKRNAQKKLKDIYK